MLKEKRRVYIGGRLGNQLLRYFIALADSFEDNYEIETIIVVRAVNYLEKLSDLRIPTDWQAGEGPSRIDHNLEDYIHRLFKHRSRIIDEGWLKLKKPDNFIRTKTCFHIRGTDKKVAPLRWYYKKAKSNLDENEVTYVCTDDKWRKYGLKIWLGSTGVSGINFTNQNAIKDWFTLLYTDKVYCSSSSFPLSTLLFDPDKEIIVCSRKSANYNYRVESGYITEFPFIETAMKYCPNLRFED